MKQKLIALRALAQRQQAKAAVFVMSAMAAGAASAQTATPTLDSILDTFIASIISGIGTTFGKIGPLLALVFGVAFAWRWVKKGASS
jgi:phage-related minor tail protein